MSVKCGWASIDESGGIHGGKAGDQTGRELKTGPWYDFGQNVVMRPVVKDSTQYDKSLGIKIAKYTEEICLNEHVGYDQWQRTTLYTELSKVNWDPRKLQVDCEVDCSAMIPCVLMCCGISINKDCYTGNLKKALLATGRFIALTGREYTTTDKNLMRGDIILNEDRHVIVALENGANTKKKGNPARYTKGDSVYYVTGANFPVEIKQGKPFELTGKITDTNTMRRVVIGVADANGVHWIEKVGVDFSSTVFDIERQANRGIKFGKLEKGHYTYRCWCVDKNGKRLVINKPFRVK